VPPLEAVTGLAIELASERHIDSLLYGVKVMSATIGKRGNCGHFWKGLRGITYETIQHSAAPR